MSLSGDSDDDNNNDNDDNDESDGGDDGDGYGDYTCKISTQNHTRKGDRQTGKQSMESVVQEEVGHNELRVL